MGAAAVKGRVARRPKPFFDADQYKSGAKLREAGVHQLFVRNLSGKSITVNADLDEDVSHLFCEFIAEEGLQDLSSLAVRFTFSGRRLERGVPLCKYGIIKGSTIRAFECPNAVYVPRGTAQRTARCAWGEVPNSSRGLGTTVPSHASTCTTEENGDSQVPKMPWVEFPVTIMTPFAEVHGVLQFPKVQWPSCRLSPRVLSKMHRVTDVVGIHASREACIADCSWRLRLQTLHPFPCIRPPLIGHVWHLLQASAPRIDVWAADGEMFHSLVNPDDELVLGAWANETVSGLHFSILLLRDREVAADDVTVMFREADPAASEEVCTLCLEPVLTGQTCSRFACIHCLHARCVQPADLCCPVCRMSIVD